MTHRAAELNQLSAQPYFPMARSEARVEASTRGIASVAVIRVATNTALSLGVNNKTAVRSISQQRRHQIQPVSER